MHRSIIVFGTIFQTSFCKYQIEPFVLCRARQLMRIENCALKCYELGGKNSCTKMVTFLLS